MYLPPRRLLAVATIALPLMLAGTTALGGDDSLRARALAVFGTVATPSPEAIASPVAQLGRRLFWDERASANGRVACASCHTAAAGSSDKRRISLTAKGTLTRRHSQPVFNAMAQSGLRWLADRPTGALQATGSLTGSMGFTSLAEAEGKLRSLGYEHAFQAAFPNSSQALSAEHYGVAIEAYEATLTTPGPFDAYLQGDDEALSAQAQKGLALFLDTGCAGCHHGPLLGGNSVQTFGIFGRYWEATGSEQIDIGLAHQTQKAEDNYRFRVPMLRNIALTAPYFHDGSVRTLSEAVDIMARLQLNTTLAPEDIGALGAFLETLSGETPPHFAPPD